MCARDSFFWSDKEFVSRLLHLALPIAFQNLMLASVAASDALMLGRVAQDSMSAVSLATQIQFVQNMFMFAITSVESILGAQYWGKKDMRAVNKVFCLALKLSCAISFLFFAGCQFFPGVLMGIFTNQDALVAIGTEYLKIAGWSYLLAGISQCYLCMMKITDHPARTATISSCTVLLNIALNAVFIFGRLGFPRMDARGAALATLVSRVVECLWCVANSYRKGYVVPRVAYLFSLGRELLADFLRCLFPLLAACLLWGIGFTSYSAFMGHLGSDATAANSIAAVIRDLLCCVCNGLCNAAGIMVGNELGAGNLQRGKRYGERILVLSAVTGLCITILCFCLTPFSVRFGKLSLQANRYLIQMMIVMSVYMFGRTFNTIVVSGVFAAGGDTIYDMYSLAICMWGVAVPLAALGTFVFHWPVFLVYSCTCLDEVGKIPWVIAHFKRYKWVKDLTRENV